jgi:hypothetical protein
MDRLECHLGGQSSVRFSNLFRIRIRSGSVHDDGVVGRRVKPRCETSTLRTFGQADSGPWPTVSSGACGDGSDIIPSFGIPIFPR